VWTILSAIVSFSNECLPFEHLSTYQTETQVVKRGKVKGIRKRREEHGERRMK